jgi:gluconate/galactonate dehydratase
VAARVTAVSTAVVEANFDYTFVRVHTSDGVAGTGECFAAPGLVPMVRELGELLVGADPRQVLPLVHRLRKAVSGTGSWSAAGIAYNAISGLETALWDLAGKLDGRPVAELLGGRFRERIPLYLDCHGGGRLESIDPLMRYRTPHWASASGETEPGELYWEAGEPDVLEPGAWLERGREAVAAGFRRLKFDLDSFADARVAADATASAGEIEAIAVRVAALRDAVGPDVGLAFDCHWRFDVPTAVRIARAVEPVAPMWLEDPVPPEPRALAQVQAATAVPIATGENTYLVEGFRELIDARAVSIVTPDPQKCGGVAETKRIFDDAALAFLQAAPHCIASPLGLVATAHACAAATNVLCIEFHGGDVPFWAELVDAEVVEGGEVVVPRRPGLGVELNEDVVRAYGRRGEPVFKGAPAPSRARRGRVRR